MAQDKRPEEEVFFEDIIKKTKTGITFPKELRETLFNEEKETFFRIIVPKEKDKIILTFLTEEEAKNQIVKTKGSKPKTTTKITHKTSDKKTSKKNAPNWGEYFIYDFKSREKIKPILESAFYKFAETPINMEDAMGRVKYALVSFMSATKSENAKLYFSVIKLLIDIIERFNQPNLIDWIFEKIVPNIESKFLYELAVLDLVEISLKFERWEKAELYIFHVLKNIDEYPKSEMYNIMNSFKQLVKKVKYVERSDKIDILLKEKLLEYGKGVEDIDYKIQIVEFLEDLKYVEIAYDLAKKIQLSLPPESMKLEKIRQLVRRLHAAPVESKRNSSIDFEDD